MKIVWCFWMRQRHLTKCGIKAFSTSFNTLVWIKFYLNDFKMLPIRTVVEREQSAWATIYASVPQGSILGPLLFLVFINDIVADIHSDIYLFADDTSLTHTIEQERPEIGFNNLHEDLIKLATWASRWHVKFNPEKTKYVVFSHHHKILYPNLCMNNQPRSRVSSHKHLGLTLDENIKWNEHLGSITTKRNKFIGTIWKLGRLIPRYCQHNYYASYIRPRLEYACVCFDNISLHQVNPLEHIQRRAALACTHVYQKNVQQSFNELGWPTLQQRRYYHQLVMFCKMVSGSAPNYLHVLISPTKGILSPRYATRSSHHLQLHLARTTSYRRSFISSTTQIWNLLDTPIKKAPTICAYKNKLKCNLSLSRRNRRYDLAYGIKDGHGSECAKGPTLWL